MAHHGMGHMYPTMAATSDKRFVAKIFAEAKQEPQSANKKQPNGSPDSAKFPNFP